MEWANGVNWNCACSQGRRQNREVEETEDTKNMSNSDIYQAQTTARQSARFPTSIRAVLIHWHACAQTKKCSWTAFWSACRSSSTWGSPRALSARSSAFFFLSYMTVETSTRSWICRHGYSMSSTRRCRFAFNDTYRSHSLSRARCVEHRQSLAQQH